MLIKRVGKNFDSEIINTLGKRYWLGIDDILNNINPILGDFKFLAAASSTVPVYTLGPFSPKQTENSVNFAYLDLNKFVSNSDYVGMIRAITKGEDFVIEDFNFYDRTNYVCGVEDWFFNSKSDGFSTGVIRYSRSEIGRFNNMAKDGFEYFDAHTLKDHIAKQILFKSPHIDLRNVQIKLKSTEEIVDKLQPIRTGAHAAIISPSILIYDNDELKINMIPYNPLDKLEMFYVNKNN